MNQIKENKKVRKFKCLDDSMTNEEFWDFLCDEDKEELIRGIEEAERNIANGDPGMTVKEFSDAIDDKHFNGNRRYDRIFN